MRVTFDQAVALIRAGEVVAIPTDTVYGLAASIMNEEAIKKIFILKQRPLDNPLVIQIGNRTQIDPLAGDVPAELALLAEHFWPGALTLVIPVNEEKVPSVVRAGKSTAGFRIPNHDLTRRLLETVGPLVVPSANISGKPAATEPFHLEEDFGVDIPILESEEQMVGLESTVIELAREQWQMLRQGVVTVDELASVIGSYPFESTCGSKGPYQSMVSWHLREESYDGSIKTVLGFARRHYHTAENVVILGDLADPKSMMRRLYAVLRECEYLDVEEIWVDMNFPRDGLLAVIASRLYAALYKKV